MVVQCLYQPQFSCKSLVALAHGLANGGGASVLAYAVACWLPLWLLKVHMAYLAANAHFRGAILLDFFPEKHSSSSVEEPQGS
jgi:hypothetical protein